MDYYQMMNVVSDTRMRQSIADDERPAVDREAVAQKARAIMASMVGAVAIAKSIPNEAEKTDVLAAAQRQILVMLGLSEDEIEALLEPDEALAS